MRYTIEGFSQIEAVKFRRIETVKRKNPRTGVYEDKEAVVALDCTDLVILRWFVDFWPRMMKVEIGGVQYAWLSYKDAIKDMPLLGVKKAAFALRLKKMVSFGILTHKTVKSNGTFSYYGFGPEYGRLIDTDHAQQNSDPAQNFNEGLHKILDTPAQNFSDQIDSSTKDSSTKEPKKERERDGDELLPAVTYDDIVDAYTSDPDIRETVFEFIKMRKLIKAPMTNKALRNMLSKLDRLSDSKDAKIQILEQSIENDWKGIFPIRDESEKPKSKRQHLKEEELRRKFAKYSKQPITEEELAQMQLSTGEESPYEDIEF